MRPQQGDILPRGSARGKAGGGFDKLRTRARHDVAHPQLLLLGQQAGLDDHFQNMRAADIFDLPDLPEYLVEAAVLQPTELKDHVDFRGAAAQRLLCLPAFGRRGAVAVRKADDGADRNGALHIVRGFADIDGRQADGGRMIGDALVAEQKNLLPGGGGRQQGMVNGAQNIGRGQDNRSFSGIVCVLRIFRIPQKRQKSRGKRPEDFLRPERGKLWL